MFHEVLTVIEPLPFSLLKPVTIIMLLPASITRYSSATVRHVNSEVYEPVPLFANSRFVILVQFKSRIIFVPVHAISHLLVHTPRAMVAETKDSTSLILKLATGYDPSTQHPQNSSAYDSSWCYSRISFYELQVKFYNWFPYQYSVCIPCRLPSPRHIYNRI